MIDYDFTVVVDTREQKPWSFDNYAKANRKLDAGDYSLEGLENIFAIERKKSVNEIANNIVETRFKDAIARLSQLKYSFLLLEFNMDSVLSYPIGSDLPRKYWDKVKVTPTFLLKNIIEWEMNYGIKVIFCGSASNAEQVAEYIFKKIYYLETKKKNG